MEIPAPLSATELASKLDELDGWTEESGKLHKEFVFGDFVEAFGFMTSAALLAERANHHPEWFNVYKKVRVDLVTHEAGGITVFDTDLALELNRLAES